MAAKDLFYDAVQQALLNEQWVITAYPLLLKIDKVVKLIVYDPVQEVIIEWKE